MNIVVLAGGTSTERDVSIVSGTGICRALRSRNHRAILVDVFCGVEDVDFNDPFPAEYDVDKAVEYIKSFNPGIEKLKADRKSFFGPNVLELCDRAEFVFLGLHGANGEDGRIQAVFDLMGIRYSGTDYLSSALAMDKGKTKELFNVHNVKTPQGFIMKRDDIVENPMEKGVPYPLVVKTCCGGSSIGVYIVHDPQEYKEACAQAFAMEDEVVVEQYIEGIEHTDAVVDGVAYPVVQIVPLTDFYNYENKYKAGATRETCPAPISEELTKRIQALAVEGYNALGLQSYARLDFIVTADEEIYCLEANTLPGMTPTSLIPQEAAVLGIDYPDLCEELIRVSMKKYRFPNYHSKTYENGDASH